MRQQCVRDNYRSTGARVSRCSATVVNDQRRPLEETAPRAGGVGQRKGNAEKRDHTFRARSVHTPRGRAYLDHNHERGGSLESLPGLRDTYLLACVAHKFCPTGKQCPLHFGNLSRFLLVIRVPLFGEECIREDP